MDSQFFVCINSVDQSEKRLQLKRNPIQSIWQRFYIYVDTGNAEVCWT
jgi:hypothetical protein